MITTADLAERMAGLEPIGLRSGGTTRLPWTAEDEATGEWFIAQAQAAGLRVQRDPAGNRWAVPDTPGPWWAVVSHLDSVPDGGRYDGALGVAAGFAVAAATTAPVAVISFADEEGARFGTPTFGSRALVGRLDTRAVVRRRDAQGTTLADALTGAGVDPRGLAGAQQWLARLAGALELHIDQSPVVADLGIPSASVSGLAGRLRMRAHLRGTAGHAGTTPRAGRRDALAAAARLIVAAEAAAPPEMMFTAGRIEVEPNAPSTIAACARVWLDARAATDSELDRWRAGVQETLATLPVDSELETLSRSAPIEFDQRVRGALGSPAVQCFAGHDAGILAERVPAGMVMVRNRTGISHSPHEHVDLEDAAAGASALARAVEELAA